MRYLRDANHRQGRKVIGVPVTAALLADISTVPGLKLSRQHSACTLTETDRFL